ncbi:cilia- and flagella-associated protein 251 isoform X2 [Synchiropus splendidus]|nr:cilia- and flagella-associated protein 251 isoform X2 [Synchiropus splendidus]
MASMSDSDCENQQPSTSSRSRHVFQKDDQEPLKPTTEDGDVEEKQRDPSSGAKEVGGGDEKVRVKSDSHVYTATKDSLFPKKKDQARTHALTLDWVFGVNRSLPFFSLQDHDQLVILYAAAHVGIIFNHTLNSQHILQGHSFPITCMCVSEDRRWIATADQGPRSMVMIWDSYSGIPVHTMFDCHPDGGVIAMAFSRDSKYLATLGNEKLQCVCIWDWTDDMEEPLWYTELSAQCGFQTYILFNPNDSSQLLSNSHNKVLLYTTSDGTLKYYFLRVMRGYNINVAGLDDTEDPPPSQGFYNIVAMAGGAFSQSVFHWSKRQILTASAGGSIVVWDLMEDFAANENLTRACVNVMSLQKEPITVLTVTDCCIVTGDTRGFITIYDENFLPLAWYEKLNLDAIVSISFSKESKEGYLEDCTLETKPLIIRNFVVSTISSIVVHVDAKKGVAQVLLDEESEPLHTVACHPKEPLVVMGDQGGVLKVRDYNRKVTLKSRIFEDDKHIESVAFDPEGLYLAVGFSSGVVQILDPNTLESNPDQTFRFTEESISHIAFSCDSKFLATADTGKAVTVFCLRAHESEPSRWEYLGRQRPHYKPIIDLLFGVHEDSKKPRLLSLGKDRVLVEYDLELSSVDNLLLLNSVRIEQSAVPTCMTWYPPLSAERSLLVVSDQYKMKLFNSSSKMCRNTFLGPKYGSPLKKVAVIPASKECKKDSYYLAYITQEKLGLQILPLDGNPFKSIALICHPSGVSAFACSYDGRFVFTAGGYDPSVMLWEISLNALEAAASLGGEDLAPFYTLLDGGREGPLFKEMEDFFYYCQIQHQGVDSMETRQVSTKIPFTEVPSLMRSLAYFPTEEEIEDIHNEVKFSKYAETGQYNHEVDLGEFIKLYVNHRPAFDVSNDALAQAFQVLGTTDGKEFPVLDRQELLELLQERGEPMSPDEVAECFTTLLGLCEENEEKENPRIPKEYLRGKPEGSLHNVISDKITIQEFINHILGFPLPPESTSPSSTRTTRATQKSDVASSSETSARI